jgi:hypothetical protein
MSSLTVDCCPPNKARKWIENGGSKDASTRVMSHVLSRELTNVPHRRRDESLLKAKQFEAEGRKSQAWEMYVKCVDITPKHAFQLIKVVKMFI